MKHGINKIIIFSLFFFILGINLHAADKITTIPLINLEDLKPSYEEVEKDELEIETNKKIGLKSKKKKVIRLNYKSINILGLDKITAKTSIINIKLGEKKKFGFLEIKAIRCGQSNSNTNSEEAAYIQVKDLSETRSDKIFVFNGWTFSSSPSLRPIEHPVYDLWLVSCDNV